MIPRDDRSFVRAVFRRAGGVDEPGVARLVAAVPSILAEAGRRRRLAEAPASRLVAAAGAWLPRLAAATALLAVAALLWPGSSRSDTGSVVDGDESQVLDTWLVTGSTSQAVADPALDVLLRQGTR